MHARTHITSRRKLWGGWWERKKACVCVCLSTQSTDCVVHWNSLVFTSGRAIDRLCCSRAVDRLCCSLELTGVARAGELVLRAVGHEITRQVHRNCRARKVGRNVLSTDEWRRGRLWRCCRCTKCLGSFRNVRGVGASASHHVCSSVTATDQSDGEFPIRWGASEPTLAARIGCAGWWPVGCHGAPLEM